ncbi:MAG: hypothetical protein FWH52_07495 [Synergistaceae bacterium]|nr:hypothetical protein [Synergistaceae bacterium]
MEQNGLMRFSLINPRSIITQNGFHYILGKIFSVYYYLTALRVKPG